MSILNELEPSEGVDDAEIKVTGFNEKHFYEVCVQIIRGTKTINVRNEGAGHRKAMVVDLYMTKAINRNIKNVADTKDVRISEAGLSVT